MACVLLNQLMLSVYSSLKFNYKDMKLFCWTDSLDCLFWIHNTKKILKQFIQACFKDQRTLEGTSWLFCSGVQNPADFLTRDLYLKGDDIKACVCYFMSNFYFFTKLLPVKNHEKCFLFHLQSSFRSRDIHIFVVFPFLFTLF